MERLISVCLWLILALHLVLRVAGNAEGDALNALKNNLADPNNLLQDWDPTDINPCQCDLGNAKLSGKLVPDLGLLSNLQYLELYSNNISGEIPEEIGNLTNLVSLDLYLNALTGHIPVTLGNLRKLRLLRLNNNSLTGQIPMALTTIETLQLLDVSNNQLEGDIPVNGSFSLFQPISFSNNRLNYTLAPPPPPMPSTASTSSGNSAVGAIVGVVAASVVLFSAPAIIFA
ncbi:hypothetical protein GOBAR_DD24668 [Gossypium barbadense]|nr:hypothetical protein GOBAR_DD24668 [Gossypium barbadense]